MCATEMVYKCLELQEKAHSQTLSNARFDK